MFIFVPYLSANFLLHAVCLPVTSCLTVSCLSVCFSGCLPPLLQTTAGSLCCVQCTYRRTGAEIIVSVFGGVCGCLIFGDDTRLHRQHFRALRIRRLDLSE